MKCSISIRSMRSITSFVSSEGPCTLIGGIGGLSVFSVLTLSGALSGLATGFGPSVLVSTLAPTSVLAPAAVVATGATDLGRDLGGGTFNLRAWVGTLSSLPNHNLHGVDMTLKAMDEQNNGIIFTNLVDFDSQWGHRNNPEGYAKGLEVVDARLPEIIDKLRLEDVLFITADHGCDPTTPSTDHSREYVPVLVFGKSLQRPVPLGIRKTFSDLGKTVADLLGVEVPVYGDSFKPKLLLAATLQTEAK